MAEKARKGPIEQQPNTTKDPGNATAPADTGDRELSDAELDRVAGGSQGEPVQTTRRSTSRAM